MKSFLVVVFVWLSLGPGLLRPAAAQCTLTPLTAGCPVPFDAIDVATSQPVTTLCVGREVEFRPACGRVVKPNLLYYKVTPGMGNNLPGCDFSSGTLVNNRYTPTANGFFSVTELTNPDTSIPGNGGTVFVRTFEVKASPVPSISLVPCLNNTVALTITASGYDQYFAQVNGGPLMGPLAPGTTTLTAAPGGTIAVSGRYLTNGLCTNQATATVPTITAPATPALGRLTVGSAALPGNLQLDVSSLPADYRYDVQRADASSPTVFRRVLLLAPNSSTVSLSGPAGLYRIGRRDFCRTDSAFSAALPTIVLTGTSINNTNTLTWQTAGSVSGYTVLRNTTALATLPAGATSYDDKAVVCGTRYTYRLQAAVPGGGQAVSNEAAITTVSSLPPPAPLLNASFTLTNQLLLSAVLPGGATLPADGQLLYGRQGGPANVDFSPVPTATDTLREPAALADLLAAPPCYTARLQDVCGNSSAPNPPTCPSLLTVAAADDDGLTTRLSWSAFRGPGSPAAASSYRVLTLAADGRVLARSASITALTYLDLTPPADRQILRYRIEASGAGLPPGTISYSNVASLVRRPLLVVPNAFTPNGDGLNDVLELKGRYLQAFIFVVVDRNGMEVFRATDRSQTWDGTIQGHAPVSAAYVWRFTMQDETGQPFTQNGSVTILK